MQQSSFGGGNQTKAGDGKGSRADATAGREEVMMDIINVEECNDVGGWVFRLGR